MLCHCEATANSLRSSNWKLIPATLPSVPQIQPRALDDKALQEYHARIDRIIAEAAELVSQIFLFVRVTLENVC
jgi:hypothetical protein